MKHSKKNNKTHKTSKIKKPKTRKIKKQKRIILKNNTPKDIIKLSNEISENLPTGNGIRSLNITQSSSYAPSINNELVSLKSIPRGNLVDCNNETAFQLKEPLKISIPGKLFGKYCVKYDDPDAKKYLLQNLSANKHIIPSKIVPPIQLKSNCWFNAMFVAFFISDKGRKFFHYFRQLMIEGKQADGTIIQPGLRNAFALLNFAIEASLNGNQYAYEMDTNNIIRQIYDSLPKKYHKKLPYIVKENNAGNPIKYYFSIIDYLGSYELDILYIDNLKTYPSWRERIRNKMRNERHLPHIIILEIYDAHNETPGYSGEITDKPTKFTIGDTEYELDSCIIRDMEQQHFCATIMTENKEMAYDGMSFHRIVPMKWKNNLNNSSQWTFKGSTDLDGNNLEWSFLHGYQMLIYYRI